MRTTRTTGPNEVGTAGAAEHLGVHRNTIFRMIERGKLTPCRKGIGNSGQYFDIRDLDKLLEEGLEEKRRVRNRDKIDPETMISTAEVTKYLGVSRWTLWRWEQEGTVTGFRDGSKVYYDRATIEAIKNGRG